MSNNTFYFSFLSKRDAAELATLHGEYDKGLDRAQLNKQGGKCYMCRQPIADINKAFFQAVRYMGADKVARVSGIVLCPSCHTKRKQDKRYYE